MKNFYRFFLVIYLVFIFITFGISTSLADDENDDEVIDVNAEITSSKEEYTQNQIKVPDINSRSAVIIDRTSNTVIYGKNENIQRKMASTTKIMTALVIIENYNLDEIIIVSKKAAGTGGSRLGLKTGDKISIRDLLYGLMLRSGNDAAVALAEFAGGDIDCFASIMNKKATELGLKNTHFETPHGLDSDEHYTTAYELALLTNYALNNKTFSQIVGTKNYTISINGQPKLLTNTNELLGNMWGVYGVKTGFTNGANRCLVTACKRENLDIICVVLGADTKKFRTQDSIKLINYAMDNFKQVDIGKLINDEFEKWKKDNLDIFYINKGVSNDIVLYIERPNYSIIPVRKDFIDNINISINCDTYFEAPLPKNSSIGNIHFKINDDICFDLAILNSNRINRKNWNFYFFDMLKNLNKCMEIEF